LFVIGKFILKVVGGEIENGIFRKRVSVRSKILLIYRILKNWGFWNVLVWILKTNIEGWQFIFTEPCNGR
jgi:hypothetical protein